MRACLFAVVLCLPGCAGLFADAHTVVDTTNDVLVKVEAAYNGVCSLTPDCGVVTAAIRDLRAAPVEQSFIFAGRALETIKFVYKSVCSVPPATLVESCAGVKVAVNAAVDAFDAANATLPE